MRLITSVRYQLLPRPLFSTLRLMLCRIWWDCYYPVITVYMSLYFVFSRAPMSICFKIVLPFLASTSWPFSLNQIPVHITIATREKSLKRSRIWKCWRTWTRIAKDLGPPMSSPKQSIVTRGDFWMWYVKSIPFPIFLLLIFPFETGNVSHSSYIWIRNSKRWSWWCPTYIKKPGARILQKRGRSLTQTWRVWSQTSIFYIDQNTIETITWSNLPSTVNLRVFEMSLEDMVIDLELDVLSTCFLWNTVADNGWQSDFGLWEIICQPSILQPLTGVLSAIGPRWTDILRVNPRADLWKPGASRS